MITALFSWLSIALLFLILEVGHPGLFFFLSFCIASLTSALLAFLDFSLMAQCIAFLSASCIALLMLNRLVKRAQRTQTKTNVYALEGKKAVVTEAIRSPKTGQVKLDGEIWTARSLNGETVAEGAIVVVIQVRGAHLVVKAAD